MEKREVPAACSGVATNEKPPSVKQLLFDFCGYTTAHGLGRLSNSRGIFSRLLWSLFCIGALTMFTLQVYNLFVIYLSRPVSTVVKVEHENHVIFPAVTICNLNMVRAEQLPDNYMKDVLENTTAHHERGNETSLNTNKTNTAWNATDDTPHKDLYESAYVLWGGSNLTESEVLDLEDEIEETILSRLARENDSTLFNMGHQFVDFVFECSYRGNDCRNYSRYWRHFWDYRYGNCFTFNGGIDDSGKKQRVLSSYITGPAGGLKLNLFVEQSQYIGELSRSVGARVVIHDQSQMPFPNNEGHSVLPQRSTSIGLRRTVIERVDPFNNGSCVQSDFIGQKDIYRKKYNTSYTRQACLNSCFAEKQISECSCVDARFPAEAEICDRKNSTTANCLNILLHKLLTAELDCEKQCPTPCREVHFKKSLSMSEWPSYQYEEILAARVKQRSVYRSEVDFGWYLSENFLQVRIFFEQLNYERVVERVAYERVNLVADLGGQLGLWIGISALTCCELLELIWLMIQSLFKRATREKVIVQPAS